MSKHTVVVRPSALTEWLMDNAGPIVRYRTAKELLDGTVDLEPLRRAMLDSAEVRKWLGRLAGGTIHGSTDHHIENVLAKLCEYGLTAEVPEFDQNARPYCEVHAGGRYQSSAFALVPMLIRAGYAEHASVEAWILARLKRLHETAKKGSYDFYLSKHEMKEVPKAWQGKPIYKPEHDIEGPFPLPSCYDLYAMAHLPKANDEIARRMEDVVAYLGDPRFQTTVGGYLWNRDKRTCYAAGRCWLACATRERLVLFLELAAPFATARDAEWFRAGVRALEGFRTDTGTYRFPTKFLAERTGYQLYGGAHMGLGENRRCRNGIEIESTFRMLRLKKLVEDA